MKLKSYRFLNDFYTVEVKNTKKGIEISDIVEHGRSAPRRAHEITDSLLCSMKEPYSKIDLSTKEGKAELKENLDERIIRLEEKIERLKMGKKMLSRKVAYFK